VEQINQNSEKSTVGMLYSLGESKENIDK